MSKVILVTGASSGIGKDTALKLINDGNIVYGAARRVDKMQDIVSAGGHIISLDVTDENQIKAAVDQIIQEQGRIDVLVNNAGYAVYGSVEETPLEDAKRQFEVNIFGLARLTQLVLPYMRDQKSGTIINISSVAGKIYTPFGAWYHATKHALEGWSDALRLELKPFHIDVVLIEPGIIATEFADVMNEPLNQRSGSGPYREMVQAVIGSSERRYGSPKSSSPPSVIADVISKAVKARKPKTRYAAGKMAKVVLFMRRILSDKVFDNMILSMIK